MARKVPEITAMFWVAKILTTALGESISDYSVSAIDPYVAVGFGALAFAFAVALQFRTKSYNVWVYWFAVTMVAVFGTMAADVTHVVLGIPYRYSSAFFALVLAAIFIAWRRVEGTVSIHSIDTPVRELFYWLTVVATFALGTATGDMTAVTLHLGYLASGILFAVLIAGVWLVRSRNTVVTFWAAYVLTRPLGASFADWTGKPVSWGGMGFGDGRVAAVLALLLVASVAYLALAQPLYE